MSISPTYFFESIFSRKNSEVEEIVIEKWYNRWLDPLTSMLLLGPDLHWVGTVVLWGFLQHLPAKYRQRPSYHLSTRHLALCHMVNPAQVIALCS